MEGEQCRPPPAKPHVWVTPNGPHPQPGARRELTREVLPPPPGPLLLPYRICPPPLPTAPGKCPPGAGGGTKATAAAKGDGAAVPRGDSHGNGDTGTAGPPQPPPPGPGSAFAGLGMGMGGHRDPSHWGPPTAPPRPSWERPAPSAQATPTAHQTTPPNSTGCLSLTTPPNKSPALPHLTFEPTNQRRGVAERAWR